MVYTSRTRIMLNPKLSSTLKTTRRPVVFWCETRPHTLVSMTIITHIMTLATHKTQGPHISIHYQKLISQPLDMYSWLFCKRAQGVTCSITRLTSTPHHSTNFFFPPLQSLTISQVTTSYQQYLPAIPPLIHLLWLKSLLLAIDKEYQTNT